ncbi:hypothetical protein [Caballeronia sp. LZ034LL]|uniref:hypothetical protein n=1 Tax=Caballeronia sp. LZ034LL TaxID=3038567 RepID=UPI002854F629|nr:hypothetical protein [Caballeronia sp. LZ034LL]MDR5837463.1 hypothetical protein [Caballeronia sp. LZ034LL]
MLVFVREWVEPEHLGGNLVPRALYLSDGRVVPTCVVLAPADEEAGPPSPGPSQVSPMVGGGYACLRTDQGIERMGTFGCIVNKDGSFYALTSRHVAGEPGQPVSAYVGDSTREVGNAVNLGLSKLAFSEAFPEFSVLKGMLNFDVGLVRISDVSNWTSQVFGIGEVGESYQATAASLTLDLIGTPLRAFGGTSGVMEGEIKALFFQPRGTGGIEYSTDVLIGARKQTGTRTRPQEPPFTRPGDSGTLWFYDPPGTPRETHPDRLVHEQAPERGALARRLQPVAVQWGGQRFRLPDGKASAFALGGFLSTVLRTLDLELEHDWSTGHDEYWGKLGHFAIGWKACELLKGKLSTLMLANQARIGFDDATLGQGKAFKMGSNAYVPLADVPDYVWVHARPNEPIQHFADIDIVDIDGGKSMLDRCHQDKRNCSATQWKAYFDGFAKAGTGPEEGALPFRVWQIWEAMVAYLEDGDVLRFVAATGILAHYVGDASQPLHCSWLHHGTPPLVEHDGRQYPVPKSSDAFTTFSGSAAAKIHSIYEEGMLEVDPVAMLEGVNKAIAGSEADAGAAATGHDAASATLDLMYAVHQRLSPQRIIDADDPTLNVPQRQKRLWANDTIRKATIASLADSVKLLASLWASAWAAGSGDALAKNKLVAFSEAELADIYRHDKTLIPSLSLAEMASSGKFEPPAATEAHGNGALPAKTPAKKRRTAAARA